MSNPYAPLEFMATGSAAVTDVMLGSYTIGTCTRVRDGRRCYVTGKLDLPGFSFNRNARTPATMRTMMARHIRTWMRCAGLAACDRNGVIVFPEAPGRGAPVLVTYGVPPPARRDTDHRFVLSKDQRMATYEAVPGDTVQRVAATIVEWLKRCPRGTVQKVVCNFNGRRIRATVRSTADSIVRDYHE